MTGFGVTAVIVLLVFIGGVVFILRARRRSRNDPNAIHILIPVSKVTPMNVAELANAFQVRWQGSITCEPVPAHLNDEQRREISYVVSDGYSAVLLTSAELPIDEGMSSVLALSNPLLKEDELNELKYHTAFLALKTLPSIATVQERVLFTVKLLMTLAAIKPVVGYASWAAQCYRPRSYLNVALNGDANDALELFHVLINVHQVDDPANQAGRYWQHTHGMGQFELPDIEVWCENEPQVPLYGDLLANCAVYMIASGKHLKPGETFSLDGSSQIHRLGQSIPVRGHFYGPTGAVRIVPNIYA